MKKERSKELFSPESCSPVLSGGIRDFTVHGTEPVPLHIYHQDYAHGGLSVPFHWHKELEWIWVEKGTLTLTLKTETRTISEGTFLSSTVTNCISSAALELPLRFTMPLYFFQKFSHVLSGFL